mmetsp:Transcript_39900/g.125328  ORF Transcript_39900/g.125328 Transcript_39900/m.125328 type:complete len:293 (-) Transcript_39900:1581-2459(-)
MDRESFPPSMPIPSSCMISLRATAVSYIRAPSPGSFAAHIQLPSAFTSSSAVTLAQTKLVTPSATDMRALAAPLRSPLIGCSPIAVTPPLTASPSLVRWECATTAQSARGVRRGPTHCCWAMRPVTLLSTLLVRNLFEPTVTVESTERMVEERTSVPERERSACMTEGGSAAGMMSEWFETKVLGGSFPSTFSSGRSTGVLPSWLSTTTHLPSPVTSPTQHHPDRSLSQIFSMVGMLSARTSAQLFSWYSAPQISRTDMVLSPTTTSRMLIFPPTGSMISLHTLQFPPAPWS